MLYFKFKKFMFYYTRGLEIAELKEEDMPTLL